LLVSNVPERVDINLVKLGALFRVFPGEFLKLGRDLPAWTTPVGIEINKDHFAAVEL
jgi:hypothetical protein